MAEPERLTDSNGNVWELVRRYERETPSKDAKLEILGGVPSCADIDAGELVIVCACGRLRPQAKPCGWRRPSLESP